MNEKHDPEDNPSLDAPSPAADGPVPQGQASGAETAPVTPSPVERVAALEIEKAEYKDRMLRIAAEFDNFKKRTRKDIAEHETRRARRFCATSWRLPTTWSAPSARGRKAANRTSSQCRVASSWSCASSSRSSSAIR